MTHLVISTDALPLAQLANTTTIQHMCAQTALPTVKNVETIVEKNAHYVPLATLSKLALVSRLVMMECLPMLEMEDAMTVMATVTLAQEKLPSV